MRRLILSLVSGLAIAVYGYTPPAFCQAYGGFGEPQVKLPDAPTESDKSVVRSDEGLLQLDQTRIDHSRQQEANYKAQMDAEVDKARMALPGVEAQAEQFKTNFTAPTLKKMLSDPASKYSLLLSWIQREHNLENQEKVGLQDYNHNLSVLSDERDSDRYNVSQDQIMTRDDYQAYQRKAYSEQELLARWGYKNADHLARIESSGGYGGYGGFGGGWGGLTGSW